MRSHVKNRFLIESVTFVHFPAQESSFYFRDFSLEFDHWVKTVCLDKEIFYFVPTCVIDESYPEDGFWVTCLSISFLILGYMLAKAIQPFSFPWLFREFGGNLFHCIGTSCPVESDLAFLLNIWWELEGSSDKIFRMLRIPYSGNKTNCFHCISGLYLRDFNVVLNVYSLIFLHSIIFCGFYLLGYQFCFFSLPHLFLKGQIRQQDKIHLVHSLLVISFVSAVYRPL